VLYDGSERRAMLQALEERTQALTRSNAELSEFAYVASHDLQAPLRKASAFAHQLKMHLADKLDAQGADFMARLLRSVESMQSLIEALLQLARVTSSEAPKRRVSLSEVAAQVIEDLEPALSQSGAKVLADPLPEVLGDPQQMRQLLQNLVGNALKFRRPEQAPVVRLRGRERPDGACELVVEDNGVGFDMKYASRIFHPFQRLHSVKDYPGTGMGLAICQKIVERHGGTISAESAPGRGSAFKVLLPSRSEAEAAASAGTERL
jgi:light-regulated signal transduction histidine kinase (bacteriophytochrome)